MARRGKVHRNALPGGAQLLWYVIDNVLGQGAFGITYLATDSNLGRAVAIKEYLPSQYAHREPDGSVLAVTDDLAEDFAAGLRRFIAEGKTLARFEHASIVRVHNVFEANGTAYMVMQYEEGDGLDRILSARGTLTEIEILGILYPLLDGLEVIHAQSFVHRDIKPANIFIRRDGSPVLLDFGSAREAMTGDSRTLTNFVSPGYAPIEQYAGKSDQQGPWTDIYGLGATMYRAMTGRAPSDAIERSRAIAQDTKDSFEAGAQRAQQTYSQTLLTAVDNSLNFYASSRPTTVAQWRSQLPPPPTPEEIATTVATQASNKFSTTTAAAPTLMMTLPPTTHHGGLYDDIFDPSVDPTAVPVAAPPVAPRRGKLPYIALGIALVVGVAIAGGSWLGRNIADDVPAPSAAPALAPAPAAPIPVTPPRAQTPKPETKTASATEVPRQEVPATRAAEPAPKPIAAQQPLPDTNPAATTEQVQTLLLGASRDLDAQRLMSPPGDNAYEKYREVQRLQPGSIAAERGIDAVAERYVDLTEREISGGNLGDAETFLSNAETIAPQQPRVIAARNALNEARTQSVNAPPDNLASPPPTQADQLRQQFESALSGESAKEQRKFLREQRKRNRF